MELYNTTLPHKSLIHEIWALCDTDVNGYPLKDVIRRINASSEELAALIMNADGTWEFDDSNYTDLPVGTGTLIEGQSQYPFASQYLTIERIKVKDKNGEWSILAPIREKELGGEAIEEYFSATGMPTHYDILGGTKAIIKLYPAPTSTSVTLASGLKVHFKRTIKVFTMSNSTTITSGEEDDEPGFPSPYHILLAYMTAIPFCMSYKQNRVALYEKKKDEMIKDLIKFYSHREVDRKKVITMAGINFR